MAEFFYINQKGDLVKTTLLLDEEGVELSAFLMRLHSFECDFQDYLWFRNGVLLDKNAYIYKNDRLFALKTARLSPAQWRAQRIARS